MSAPTLRIRDLSLGFSGHAGTVEVLHGISLHIARGERVALVGESGSGKSVTARIVLGLLQQLRSARISGLVEFEGRDLGALSERERHALRGTEMSMIFQDPTSSLNPVYPVITQFHEVLRRRLPGLTLSEARRRASAALDGVAIAEPDRVLDSYPALDVTVQAQTLKLMRGLVEKHNTAVLFISHNLGVVREFADRVYVIYRGRIVEQGPAAGLFEDPRHPYTRALLTAVPRITGGGVPEIEDASEAYFAPIEVHEGYGEPEVAG